ncbi:pseudoazurin [Methylocystis hirsuta]|uniref:Pseudoazurin n=1 Tax=Methylocystis hirsuta TaxID=369798 RepID=A0A3M9XS90_9HYPH|nr:pseudoazurin [Methylocystis hirsuta]RNJ50891.1 pseudoazurin [Methylocystis hirsuta]
MTRAYLTFGRPFGATALALAILIGWSRPSMAGETVEIKMLNKGADRYMVFEPEVVRINPGDTIKFVAADKGHNAVTIKELLPSGAEPFRGKINEELAITLSTPGVYGFRCDPHYTLGMVGVVIVGEPTNLDAAKQAKLPGKAGEVMTKLLGSL